MRYHKKVQLKNGKTCILRNPNCEDAQAILQHMILTSGETENMLRYSDEVTMTEAEERTYLSDIESSSVAIMISAVVDGKIVANAGFNPISTRSIRARLRISGPAVESGGPGGCATRAKPANTKIDTLRTTIFRRSNLLGEF